MILPRPLDQVLKGQTIKQFTDRQKILVVVGSPDRAMTSQEIVQQLTKLKIPHRNERAPGSSFPALIFVLNGKEVRITFKPLVVALDSRLTALMESAQCIYMAAALRQRSTTTEYVKQNLQQLRPMYEIDVKESDIFERVDKTWARSLELTANHFIPKLRRKSVVFHRNSRDVQQIYECYNRLNRADRKFSQADKWNPADIWAIDRSINVANELRSVESFEELNNLLRKHITDGTIVPISLKKVNRAPKITPINTEISPGAEKQSSLEYDKIQVNTGRTDWSSSKNVRICFNKGPKELYLELRQSSPGKALNVELNVRRDPARHGKIRIQDVEAAFAKHNGRFSFPDKRTLDKQSHEYDPELVKKVVDLANRLDTTSNVELEQFQQALQEKKDPDWLRSKYEGLLVLEAFSKMNAQNKQHTVEMLYTAATASNDLAGPFLKISQE